MADPTVTNSSPSVASCNLVIDAFEGERERLFAIAGALLTQLEPEDQKNPKDDDKLSAWRLTEVMYNLLSSTAITDFARQMLVGGAK